MPSKTTSEPCYLCQRPVPTAQRRDISTREGAVCLCGDCALHMLAVVSQRSQS